MPESGPSSRVPRSNPNRRRELEEPQKFKARSNPDHRGSQKLCLFLDQGKRRAYQRAGTSRCQHLGTRNSSATTHLALLFQPGPRPKFRDSPTRANQMRLLKTLYTKGSSLRIPWNTSSDRCKAQRLTCRRLRHRCVGILITHGVLLNFLRIWSVYD